MNKLVYEDLLVFWLFKFDVMLFLLGLVEIHKFFSCFFINISN